MNQLSGKVRWHTPLRSRRHAIAALQACVYFGISPAAQDGAGNALLAHAGAAGADRAAAGLDRLPLLATAALVLSCAARCDAAADVARAALACTQSSRSHTDAAATAACQWAREFYLHVQATALYDHRAARRPGLEAQALAEVLRVLRAALADSSTRSSRRVALVQTLLYGQWLTGRQVREVGSVVAAAAVPAGERFAALARVLATLSNAAHEEAGEAVGAEAAAEVEGRMRTCALAVGAAQCANLTAQCVVEPAAAIRVTREA